MSWPIWRYEQHEQAAPSRRDRAQLADRAEHVARRIENSRRLPRQRLAQHQRRDQEVDRGEHCAAKNGTREPYCSPGAGRRPPGRRMMKPMPQAAPFMPKNFARSVCGIEVGDHGIGGEKVAPWRRRRSRGP